PPVQARLPPRHAVFRQRSARGHLHRRSSVAPRSTSAGGRPLRDAEPFRTPQEHSRPPSSPGVTELRPPALGLPPRSRAGSSSPNLGGPDQAGPSRSMSTPFHRPAPLDLRSERRRSERSIRPRPRRP